MLKEYIEYLPSDCKFLFSNVLGEQLKARGLTKAIEYYNYNLAIQRTGIHKFIYWFAKNSLLLGIN